MALTLSIIVPAYNAENYIQSCVESILASSFRDFELILIDDGSTDGTGALCDVLEQRDPRIRVFHTENRGLSMARNLGIDHASGKYIGFVDADDMIHPDMYKKLVHAIETASAQLACCRYFSCKRTELPTNQLKDGTVVITDKKGAAEYLCGMQYNVAVWNKLYDREILEENQLRFRQDYAVAEDCCFSMEYLQYVKQGIFLEDPLYYYIQNQGSLMDHFGSKIIDSKYTAEPRAWSYVAGILSPISSDLSKIAQQRAAMNYQRILRRLSEPEAEFIREAQVYSRKHKSALWLLPETRKLYFSAVLLSISYPLWAMLFRRGMQ